ncbi:MAG: DMT family transporter [Pseudomonadota bacterium]
MTSLAPSGLAYAPVKGVALMAAAVAAFSAQDATMKWLTDGYGVPQILFFGRLLAVPLAVALALRAGGMGLLKTRRPAQHALRGLYVIATMLLFTYALKLLPIADAIAICFAAPLFMTALSAPLLSERVGPRRWAAVAVGFGGVIVILQPSGAGFGLPGLLALGSAGAYALLLIASRKLTATENGPCLMFWNSISMVAVMGVAMAWDFRVPVGIDIAVFAGAAVFGALGQLFVTEAFRYGEVSLLAPIEYTALIWATLYGWLLWGHLPTLTVLAGAAIIIASSAYILQREARLGKQQAAALNPVASPADR